MWDGNPAANSGRAQGFARQQEMQIDISIAFLWKRQPSYHIADDGGLVGTAYSVENSTR